jgi:hypothetical protein
MPKITVDSTSQTFSGNRQPDPDLCLLHTTEVWGWPGYKGGTEAPHVTVKPLPGVGIQVRVHRPATDYGKALANREGGVETNRRGVYQVELMGTCDPSRKGELYYWPDADGVVLEALAEFLRPTFVRFDIPMVSVAPFLPYPKSYGSKGGQRLTFTAWNKARGICGHQHAPENDHGDPGAFPVARFIEFLKEDDMPTAKEIADEVLSRPVNDAAGAEKTVGWAIGAILRDGQRQNAALATLKAADPAAIAAAVVNALPATFGDVDEDKLAKAIVVELVKETQHTTTGGTP